MKQNNRKSDSFSNEPGGNAEVRRSPTFARGMVQALDDHLMNRVHG
jgi:hypothetical protein